ncbi:hypothetical protein ABZV68_05580 [Streptomyces clavifer]|uniref:hypothetical protein n=1 Tax=Streptomyces TaxID=1883 RepID=UPI0029AE403B|nr:hypothetical protein [Streptomyces sp. ND04-05B]MDX3065130.1 hypothetical protein [Streptomyces sp. ND04-05B]
MRSMIPRGSWLDDDIFRELVKEIAPLRLGGWSLLEFERATSALGWELREPREVAGQVWRRFLPRKGPWGGYGTVIADASEPEQIRKLRVPVVDLPPEDAPTAADLVRAAWWIAEEELGPATMWGGRVGPWMLWQRPDSSLVVHSDRRGQVNLELVHTDADPDAGATIAATATATAAATAAPEVSRGAWRAADPAHLPPVLAAPAGPSTRWDEVQERLYQALSALTHDTPFFPGRFILHLGSAHDLHRFVQCWSHGAELVIEATGYLHRPELADPARLAERGWDRSHSLWQRRFPRAREERACSTTAARMLVEEMQNLGIGPADIVYSGTMSGRGLGFHLDLPGLGLRRSQS